jgi:hypothetical protein
MKAITPADLYEWLESQYAADAHRDDPVDPNDPYSGPAAEKYFAEQEAQERTYIASLTAAQRLDYLVHLGQLGKECPHCHTRYVEVSWFDFPDMVGDTFGETYECCGYSWSRSSALEYNQYGEAVDVR